MISVLVVDDHPIVRHGLIHALGGFEGVMVVGHVGDADATALARSLLPQVVLIDPATPAGDTIRGLLRAHPAARVVVLTSHPDRDLIVEAFEAGAAGFMLKDAEPADLLRAVEAVAGGGCPLDPRAAAVMLETHPGHRHAPGGLSGREREVLAMVGRGLANKQIARRLGISEKTVKAHLTSIFRRIGAVDRTQAALWAHRHGLLER